MDYKDLFTRILISVFFLFIYFLLVVYSFKYVLLLVLIIYIIISFEVLFNFKNYRITIIIYLLLSFSSIYFHKFDPSLYLIFNLMVTIIITFDIFSYLVGKFYGRRKISHKISPNKTLEGLIGGICFSVSASIFFCYLFNLLLTPQIIIFTLAIIVSAFFGDMIESIFKRLNNIKNSSNILPGHGGFFDRFDSFILSLITFSFIIKFI
tara:strand:+ start:565 stop:1188 length:624 start_codon:yes stop_codon:yes gene_type:complete